MLAKAIGKQLTCVFVDHGLLRKNEREEVCSVFGEGGLFDINFVCVDARERFYSKLAGVTAPEAKRKIIGEEFIRVFEEEAKKIGAVDYLAQGTIYPDVVESGLGGESATIKSHHNVGGLPDFVDFQEIIEPLRMLFKDEVRQLGRELGLPEYLVSRQPFPGPGLAIRIIGDITKGKGRHPSPGGLHLPGGAGPRRGGPVPEPILRGAHQHPLGGGHGGWPDLRLHPGPPSGDHR